MEINLTVNAELRQTFAWISVTCSLLFKRSVEADDLTIELKHWSNDHGVEFDLLQSVFPSRIPEFDELDVENPPNAKISSLSALILCVSVAMQVDASFEVQDSSGERLSVHDGCILIETSNDEVLQNEFIRNY